MARHPTPRLKKPKSSRTNGNVTQLKQLDQTTPAPTLAEPDVSRYLGFTVAWLRVRRRDKTGPAFVRAGRSIRYRVVDLEAWLVAHTVPTRDQKAS